MTTSTKLRMGNKRIGPPATVNWNAVERLVKFLIIFYNSTLVVSASTTVSSHKCYGEIVTIETNLTRLSQSLDKELKGKADCMKAKFEKYWGGMKNVNKMVIVAYVFDSTKKMQFAKLCFEKFHGKETVEAKAMYQSVHIVLTDMFKQYSLRLRRDSTGGLSSQSTQASSSNGQDQDQDQGLGENVEEAMDLVDDLCYEMMDFAYTELVAEIGVEEARDELELYLKEKVENPKNFLGTEYDVLSWWKLNCQKYPILAEMSKDVLAMQVSSVASESAFSTSGRLIDPFRSCLTHYMIEVLMCTEQWMKADINMCERRVTNAQMLAEVELHDKLEKGTFSSFLILTLLYALMLHILSCNTIL